MATIRPSDPRQLLEDAATTYGSFADVRPETLPGEIPGSDLPVLAIDPREEEEEHGSSGSGGRLYEGVPKTLVIYIAVESGTDAPSRSAARSAYRTHRDGYLEQLFDEVESSAFAGAAEKTSSTTDELQQAESTLFMGALSIRFHQTQIYQ